MKKTQKGFTLIELLVVIAIIGILSAIVLASLSNARSKAKDAKIQGELAETRSAAEIYYSNSGNYGLAISNGNCASAASMFVDPTSGMNGLTVALKADATSILCSSNGAAWAAQAPLVSNVSNYWCADSSGASKAETVAFTNASYVCP